MSNSQNSQEKLMGMLGLAARAGKLIYGTPMICEALKERKKIYYVFRAKGCSDNTRKRIEDRCKYYGVSLIDVELDTPLLASRLGKQGELAAVALTDASFAEGIEKLL